MRRGEQEGIIQAAFSSALFLSLFLPLSLSAISSHSRCIINGKRGASIYARPLLPAFHAWNYIDPRESLSSSRCLPCPPSLSIVPVVDNTRPITVISRIRILDSNAERHGRVGPLICNLDFDLFAARYRREFSRLKFYQDSRRV